MKQLHVFFLLWACLLGLGTSRKFSFHSRVSYNFIMDKISFPDHVYKEKSWSSLLSILDIDFKPLVLESLSLVLSDLKQCSQ